ncbi:MAG: lysophospholipid acyltransferase family protein [Desulfuromonadales bacterium]|nr:lysophospholipid acyltransferase family protein [Desulfuromonadales bacterium]MBN2793638.1 lysophospholipid acyltransferase family protein [Desulfuromonadales bacterium]
MSLQTLVNSRVGVGLGLAVGRTVPSSLSYSLVNLLAGKLARAERRPLIQTIQNNQQMVRSATLEHSDLQRAVEDVLRFTGRCFVDLYRNFSNPEKLSRKIRINADLERLIALSRDEKFAAFVVVPHMSSFDLMLLAAANLGLKTKVLTFGQPTGGYKLQNEIRALSGLDIMPVSRRTNLSALASLRQGGFVLTAVDRPVTGQGRVFNFFGRPSPLPDGHIRMALKADVPVLAAAVHMDEEGFYQLQLSEPLTMQRLSDPEEEVRFNAERVLGVLEGYIRAHPSQWQMFYPVWQ